MKIGLNVIGFAPGTMGGAETYFRNLLFHLQTYDSANSYAVLCDRLNTGQFQLFNPAFTFREFNFARPSVPWFVRCALRNTIRIDPLRPVLDRLDVDVIHHPFTVLNPRGGRIPSVLTFHDMQHEFLPQLFTPLELWRRNAAYRPSVKQATRIIAISEHVKQCLIDRYGAPHQKIDVVYQGCGPEFRVLRGDEAMSEVREKHGLAKPFLYYPAATWPHKNHLVLLEALKLLRERHRFDGELVLSGISIGSNRAILDEIERKGLGRMVRILGYLPHEELPYIYNLARLMVFPSLFEGFGIPLVEAMASGCPIVCSNVTSLPEVVGDAAVMFDPLSPEDMALAIWSVWNDDTELRLMGERGIARARIFSWEEAAYKTVAVYRRTMHGSG